MPLAPRRRFLQSAAGTLAGAGFPPAAAAARIKPGANAVLIVVDVQNCFVPGGALPVARGDEVVPVINRIATAFDNVVLTQDWHTPGHISFASSHAGKKPFDTIRLGYGEQRLWPDHCVQGSQDAALHKDLHLPQAQMILRKGFHPQVDSYSAFEEADHKTATGLTGYLRQRGIESVFVAGLATDFCVAWTALDARRLGFDTSVVEDACRAIDIDGSLQAAWKQMQAKGIERIQSGDIDIG
ncbi:bifunctional nicotinamidase/pyrazinamidase [Verminephrobacter eiseniae]|uniref:Nicotinamidase n=1 Tax=Verminephrobacter eiseniae (strain EF01-2) TaxID=391735 RepID=A1WG83_VEREI|nr:bifunctional nicotinamidase/pyrazinamidase [Verminephrobacter eiseniae]ABM56640.1 Nicotinamidase [Verminephrobacter eiseniae EF01-2]MCW5286997.1 bifunctional nicotinamidase/pyrazinamidase [Verminephrobacter eiseniae]MCW5305295.1 bifunctional nicotinamidase/pyrazinamidase [Verminephrobacter eiseniae]MCW8182548.1 bifunctional nicotinamidase/pyrazinamidase [Verminephrobacter eiseniae]MCW8189724.1 bifunctional nicotinamidase/pyrazinamidase [Verminephrobacter eiseniae]